MKKILSILFLALLISNVFAVDRQIDSNVSKDGNYTIETEDFGSFVYTVFLVLFMSIVAASGAIIIIAALYFGFFK